MIAAISRPGSFSPSVPQTDVSALAVLRALADPTRYRIFLSLWQGETCNCELGQALGLTSNLVSHHLRQLREVGLIQEHRDPADARWLHISIDPAGLAAARAMLSPLFDAELVGARTPACGLTRAGPR